jgi:hypothetical protein
LDNKKVNTEPPYKKTHQQNHCKINLPKTPTTTTTTTTLKNTPDLIFSIELK